MRLHTLVVGLFAFSLIACTVQSENPSVGDATKAYLAPAVCETGLRCAGTTRFMLAYPGGIADCEQKLYDHTANKDKVSDCTNDQYKTCVADYRATMCGTDPQAGFLPPIPTSCNGC